MSTSRGTWRRACRCPRSKDPKGVALFGRVVGAPSDRNLIDFYADGGITFSGMIPRRPDDSLAIGVAYTGISDRSAPSTSTPPFLWRAITRRCVRSATPHSLPSGWTLQPDFQYFWQPGGNMPNDTGNGAVPNAAVFGACSTMSF
ncbi:MAG: carbohydrate porin [Methyloceanibacter sp.]